MFELLTARSNQAINDECHHTGNTSTKLRTYSDSVGCATQNEIKGTFLNAIGGFCERFYHTHLQPLNPSQAHFPSGPTKMYPQSINPPLLTLLLHLSRLKTLSVSAYNNSLPSQSFHRKIIKYKYFWKNLDCLII